MRTSYFFLFLTFATLSVCAQKIQVNDLMCEYQDNPLGIDVLVPRLSWKLVSLRRGVTQQTYELRVGTDKRSLGGGKNIIWQTSKVVSDQSILIPYGGPPVEGRKKYYWQVRVTDNAGNMSPWSDVHSWEMGLLKPGDWSAGWIEPDLPGDSVGQPAPLLRRDFELKQMIRSARLYVTSHGLNDIYLNGQRVSDHLLNPGWTSYNKRLQYATYDVTSLLKSGKNAAGAMLGDGWYRSSIASPDNKNIYGKNLGLLFQLEVEYADGTKTTVTSDQQWKSSTGPILKSGIYYGEVYDARLEKSGWANAGFDDSNWRPVRLLNVGKDNLVASYGPPVRRHEIFKALKIFKTPRGENVVDFGQNLVGWIKLTVRGKAGQTITIHHAEVLDKQGNFYTENLRSAEQEIKYTLKGVGEEIYEPRFSFFGFRYIRIDGFPGEIQPNNIEATAIYSDMSRTGNFTCSNALVNQLQRNIQWGQKGNFIDIPTDCPQRDERLGWTGDAQVFARTAAFNMNVAAFFSKWLKDLQADQLENGRVPFVIPNVLGRNASGSAGWADASAIIPWTVYRAYGDKRVLEQQYASMKAWVDYMQQHAVNGLWDSGFHFGDWLFYRPADDTDGTSAVTDKSLITQCFWAHSTQLLINIASVLNKQEDVTHYTESLQRIKDAFVKEFTTASGRLVSSTQTAYVLALNFDMLPEHLRYQAAQRLVQNVEDYGHHLTTGFLGTPYLCSVLTRFGHTDVAYKLLLQEDYPSWLYPVKMGATTIWERWDGIRPDSTFQTTKMNSFNHYAYGAIGDWMYRTVAGLQEQRPGYREIKIAPEPGGGLTAVAAELMTPYGQAKSAWKIENGIFMLDVVVPANTSAIIILPKAANQKITEQNISIDKVKDIRSVETSGENISLQTGSGSYHFEYPMVREQ